MTYKNTVYCFDSFVALKLAEKNVSTIFFYNGDTLADAPKNCISVPIDSFYDYFLKTTHPVVSEFNFEGTHFSKEVQDEVLQSLKHTIEIIRQRKIELVNTLLETPIEQKLISVMLFAFLKHLFETRPVQNELSIIIKKLLEITYFLKESSFTPDTQTDMLATNLLSILNPNTSIIDLHLFTIINFLQNSKPNKVLKEDYFDLLIACNDIQGYIKEFNLIKTLYPEDDFSLYCKYLADAFSKQSILNLNSKAQKAQIYKLYYLTSINYGRNESFKIIFAPLHTLFLEALKHKLDELIMFLYTPLAMSWNGVAHTPKELEYFNENIEKPLENFIKNVMIHQYKIKPVTRKINSNKVIKVAFLQERLLNYSIYKVFYSLIQALIKNPSTRYEFTVYDLNFQEFGGSTPEIVEKLKKLGVRYIDLHKEIIGENFAFYPIVKKALKVRKRLISDNTDILIGMHSRPEYNFLYTTRTAPIQIYWSHGNNEYMLDGIDTYISHFGVDSEHSNYKNFRTPIDFEKYNPPVNQSLVQSIKEYYGKEKFILGSIGRLSKIDNFEYLDTIAQILKQNPHAVYLACGLGTKELITKKLQDLNIADRVFFAGHINPNVYGHVIDLLLSPFPQSGGEALQEYMYKGKAFVLNSEYYEANIQTCNDYKLLEKLDKRTLDANIEKIYTQENISNLRKHGYLFEQNKSASMYFCLPSVKNAQEYIAVANLLIQNDSVREKVGEETLLTAKLRNQSSCDTFLNILDQEIVKK